MSEDLKFPKNVIVDIAMDSIRPISISNKLGQAILEILFSELGGPNGTVVEVTQDSYYWSNLCPIRDIFLRYYVGEEEVSSISSRLDIPEELVEKSLLECRNVIKNILTEKISYENPLETFDKVLKDRIEKDRDDACFAENIIHEILERYKLSCEDSLKPVCNYTPGDNVLKKISLSRLIDSRRFPQRMVQVLSDNGINNMLELSRTSVKYRYSLKGFGDNCESLVDDMFVRLRLQDVSEMKYKSIYKITEST